MPGWLSFGGVQSYVQVFDRLGWVPLTPHCSRVARIWSSVSSLCLRDKAPSQSPASSQPAVATFFLRLREPSISVRRSCGRAPCPELLAGHFPACLCWERTEQGGVPPNPSLHLDKRSEPMISEITRRVNRTKVCPSPRCNHTPVSTVGNQPVHAAVAPLQAIL